MFKWQAIVLSYIAMIPIVRITITQRSTDLTRLLKTGEQVVNKGFVQVHAHKHTDKHVRVWLVKQDTENTY